jgi:hypothetical protein
MKAGRRLSIPRRGSPATATDARSAVGGNGATVDASSGHGFASSKPVSMFDGKYLTLKVLAHAKDGAQGRVKAGRTVRSEIKAGATAWQPVAEVGNSAYLRARLSRINQLQSREP